MREALESQPLMAHSQSRHKRMRPGTHRAAFVFRFALKKLGWSGGSLHVCLEEGQQILIDQLLVRRAQSMRGAIVDPQLCLFDKLGLESTGVADRNDLIVVALNDERR